jgi:hypothetical protein
VEAQYDANALRNLLIEHADRLTEIARRFEEVDGETVDQISMWDQMLQGLKEIIGILNLPPQTIEEYFSKYHQYQGDSSRCADFSLSMVCNIFFDGKGESTAKCDVDKITKYLESIMIGKFPNNGGTTPLGIEAALLMLGIPFSPHLQGTLKDIENALQDHKLVMVSEGNITIDKDKYLGLEVKLGPLDPKIKIPIPQFWGHVMVIVGEDGDDFLLLDPSKPNEAGVTRMKKSVFLENWWFPQFHPYWIIG